MGVITSSPQSMIMNEKGDKRVQKSSICYKRTENTKEKVHTIKTTTFKDTLIDLSSDKISKKERIIGEVGKAQNISPFPFKNCKPGRNQNCTEYQNEDFAVSPSCKQKATETKIKRPLNKKTIEINSHNILDAVLIKTVDKTEDYSCGTSENKSSCCVQSLQPLGVGKEHENDEDTSNEEVKLNYSQDKRGSDDSLNTNTCIDFVKLASHSKDESNQSASSKCPHNLKRNNLEEVINGIGNQSKNFVISNCHKSSTEHTFSKEDLKAVKEWWERYKLRFCLDKIWSSVFFQQENSCYFDESWPDISSLTKEIRLNYLKVDQLPCTFESLTENVTDNQEFGITDMEIDSEDSTQDLEEINHSSDSKEKWLHPQNLPSLSTLATASIPSSVVSASILFNVKFSGHSLTEAKKIIYKKRYDHFLQYDSHVLQSFLPSNALSPTSPHSLLPTSPPNLTPSFSSLTHDPPIQSTISVSSPTLTSAVEKMLFGSTALNTLSLNKDTLKNTEKLKSVKFNMDSILPEPESICENTCATSSNLVLPISESVTSPLTKRLLDLSQQSNQSLLPFEPNSKAICSVTPLKKPRIPKKITSSKIFKSFCKLKSTSSTSNENASTRLESSVLKSATSCATGSKLLTESSSSQLSPNSSFNKTSPSQSEELDSLKTPSIANSSLADVLPSSKLCLLDPKPVFSNSSLNSESLSELPTEPIAPTEFGSAETQLPLVVITKPVILDTKGTESDSEKSVSVAEKTIDSAGDKIQINCRLLVKDILHITLPKVNICKETQERRCGSTLNLPHSAECTTLESKLGKEHCRNYKKIDHQNNCGGSLNHEFKKNPPSIMAVELVKVKDKSLNINEGSTNENALLLRKQNRQQIRTKKDHFEQNVKSEIIVKHDHGIKLENAVHFEDKSIPEDPSICKKDEENIETSLEPLNDHFLAKETSAQNISESIESVVTDNLNSLAVSTGPRTKNPDKMDVGNFIEDHSISVSEDESDKESYVRPRVINGFGKPLILFNEIISSLKNNKEVFEFDPKCPLSKIEMETGELQSSSQSYLKKNKEKRGVSKLSDPLNKKSLLNRTVTAIAEINGPITNTNLNTVIKDNQPASAIIRSQSDNAEGHENKKEKSYSEKLTLKIPKTDKYPNNFSNKILDGKTLKNNLKPPSITMESEENEPKPLPVINGKAVKKPLNKNEPNNPKSEQSNHKTYNDVGLKRKDYDILNDNEHVHEKRNSQIIKERDLTYSDKFKAWKKYAHLIQNQTQNKKIIRSMSSSEMDNNVPLSKPSGVRNILNQQMGQVFSIKSKSSQNSPPKRKSCSEKEQSCLSSLQRTLSLPEGAVPVKPSSNYVLDSILSTMENPFKWKNPLDSKRLNKQGFPLHPTMYPTLQTTPLQKNCFQYQNKDNLSFPKFKDDDLKRKSASENQKVNTKKTSIDFTSTHIPIPGGELSIKTKITKVKGHKGDKNISDIKPSQSSHKTKEDVVHETNNRRTKIFRKSSCSNHLPNEGEETSRCSTVIEDTKSADLKTNRKNNDRTFKTCAAAPEVQPVPTLSSKAKTIVKEKSKCTLFNSSSDAEDISKIRSSKSLGRSKKSFKSNKTKKKEKSLDGLSNISFKVSIPISAIKDLSFIKVDKTKEMLNRSNLLISEKSNLTKNKTFLNLDNDNVLNILKEPAENSNEIPVTDESCDRNTTVKKRFLKMGECTVVKSNELDSKTTPVKACSENKPIKKRKRNSTHTKLHTQKETVEIKTCSKRLKSMQYNTNKLIGEDKKPIMECKLNLQRQSEKFVKETIPKVDSNSSINEVIKSAGQTFRVATEAGDCYINIPSYNSLEHSSKSKNSSQNKIQLMTPSKIQEIADEESNIRDSIIQNCNSPVVPNVENSGIDFSQPIESWKLNESVTICQKVTSADGNNFPLSTVMLNTDENVIDNPFQESQDPLKTTINVKEDSIKKELPQQNVKSRRISVVSNEHLFIADMLTNDEKNKCPQTIQKRRITVVSNEHLFIGDNYTNTEKNMCPQTNKKRRISVVSPEQLFEGNSLVNSEHSNKRQTWYMSPEASISKSTDMQRDKSLKATTEVKEDSELREQSFSSVKPLIEDYNKRQDFLKHFHNSISKEKREFEKLSDFIDIVELDLRLKDEEINSVKKLPSQDVVESEINRIMEEFNKKLIDREKHFRETVKYLLQISLKREFKEPVYLAIFVLLSWKLTSISNKQVEVRVFLFALLKKWLTTDGSENLFNLTEKTFQKEYEQMEKWLNESTYLKDFKMADTTRTINTEGHFHKSNKDVAEKNMNSAFASKPTSDNSLSKAIASPSIQTTLIRTSREISHNNIHKLNRGASNDPIDQTLQVTDHIDLTISNTDSLHKEHSNLGNLRDKNSCENISVNQTIKKHSTSVEDKVVHENTTSEQILGQSQHHCNKELMSNITVFDKSSNQLNLVSPLNENLIMPGSVPTEKVTQSNLAQNGLLSQCTNKFMTQDASNLETKHKNSMLATSNLCHKSNNSLYQSLQPRIDSNHIQMHSNKRPNFETNQTTSQLEYRTSIHPLSISNRNNGNLPGMPPFNSYKPNFLSNDEQNKAYSNFNPRTYRGKNHTENTKQIETSQFNCHSIDDSQLTNLSTTINTTPFDNFAKYQDMLTQQQFNPSSTIQQTIYHAINTSSSTTSERNVCKEHTNQENHDLFVQYYPYNPLITKPNVSFPYSADRRVNFPNYTQPRAQQSTNVNVTSYANMCNQQQILIGQRYSSQNVHLQTNHSMYARELQYQPNHQNQVPINNSVHQSKSQNLLFAETQYSNNTAVTKDNIYNQSLHANVQRSSGKLLEITSRSQHLTKTQKPQTNHAKNKIKNPLSNAHSVQNPEIEKSQQLYSNVVNYEPQQLRSTEPCETISNYHTINDKPNAQNVQQSDTVEVLSFGQATNLNKFPNESQQIQNILQPLENGNFEQNKTQETSQPSKNMLCYFNDCNEISNMSEFALTKAELENIRKMIYRKESHVETPNSGILQTPQGVQHKNKEKMSKAQFNDSQNLNESNQNNLYFENPSLLLKNLALERIKFIKLLNYKVFVICGVLLYQADFMKFLDLFENQILSYGLVNGLKTTFTGPFITSDGQIFSFQELNKLTDYILMGNENRNLYLSSSLESEGIFIIRMCSPQSEKNVLDWNEEDKQLQSKTTENNFFFDRLKNESINDLQRGSMKYRLLKDLADFGADGARRAVEEIEKSSLAMRYRKQ